MQSRLMSPWVDVSRRRSSGAIQLIVSFQQEVVSQSLSCAISRVDEVTAVVSQARTIDAEATFALWIRQGTSICDSRFFEKDDPGVCM